MRTEVRNSENPNGQHTENVSLIVIEPDEQTTISMSPAGVEVERFDVDGNRLSQKWMDMSELVELFK
jgi:hypothetical protein